jgi:demethylmenaquinone methyltransferase/2-methoxy-6-polyprenyl-1,4-benzoquinol methylase
MLGVYTEAFGNSRKAEAIFKKYNFTVQYQEYFFGCASGIRGIKQLKLL